MYTHSNYWGDADVDHSQTIGGDTAKLLGGYIPPSPPCFGTPVYWNDFDFTGRKFGCGNITASNLHTRFQTDLSSLIG